MEGHPFLSIRRNGELGTWLRFLFAPGRLRFPGAGIHWIGLGSRSPTGRWAAPPGPLQSWVASRTLLPSDPTRTLPATRSRSAFRCADHFPVCSSDGCQAPEGCRKTSISMQSTPLVPGRDGFGRLTPKVVRQLTLCRRPRLPDTTQSTHPLKFGDPQRCPFGR